MPQEKKLVEVKFMKGPQTVDSAKSKMSDLYSKGVKSEYKKRPKPTQSACAITYKVAPKKREGRIGYSDLGKGVVGVIQTQEVKPKRVPKSKAPSQYPRGRPPKGGRLTKVEKEARAARQKELMTFLG